MPRLTSADSIKLGSTAVDKLYMGSTQVWTNGDVDANAFIAAAGISNSTQQSAIQTLVTSLKTAGVWTKLYALWPMVGGTAATHKWNLKDPRDVDAAFRLTFTGTWTHSSTGAKPDGTTAYADTLFNDLSGGWTNTSASLGFYSRTNSVTTTCYDMGVADTDDIPTTMVIARYSGDNFYAGNRSTTFPFVSNADGRGFFVSQRNGTNQEGYKGGVRVINKADAQDTAVNTTVYLGACRKPSIGAVYFSPKEHALSFIGQGMTTTQQADFYTAVQAFQTTLGRQV